MQDDAILQGEGTAFPFISPQTKESQLRDVTSTSNHGYT